MVREERDVAVDGDVDAGGGCRRSLVNQRLVHGSSRSETEPPSTKSTSSRVNRAGGTGRVKGGGW